MPTKVSAIVLSAVRHSDQTNVVTLFTREHGRLTVASPVSKGKGARLRAARLLPLSLIRADIDIRPSREIQRLGSFELARPYTDLYFHPVKSAIVFFLSEFLTRFLRDSPAEPPLFDHLAACFAELDTAPDTDLALYPSRFLARLLPFAGLQPNVDGFSPGKGFDMKEGCYVALTRLSPTILTGEEARIPLYVNYLANSSGSSPEAPRKDVLFQFLLRYLSLHLPGLDNLKSPEILHSLLHS